MRIRSCACSCPLHTRWLPPSRFRMAAVKGAARVHGVRVTVREARYDLIAHPSDVVLDIASERVHGITAAVAHAQGRSLRDVLSDFLEALRSHDCMAIVAHDVVGDVTLLVSESLRAGLQPAACRAFRRLLCTKLLSAAHCRIPLPEHLRCEYPCDLFLRRLNGEVASNEPHGPAYKWPSLAECCALLTRRQRTKFPAHDARGDVERCRLIFGQLLR